MDHLFSANWMLAIGALLGLAGILSSRLAARLGVPLLLVFFLIGMLAGEDGPGGFVFDDYRLSYLIGSAALAIILFDGGLRTRISAIKPILAPSLLLATLGVLISAILTAFFMRYVLELPFLEGLLMGAIVAPTDAAAILLLLRSGGLELRRRAVGILEAESGTNDPVAMFLTILLVEILLSGHFLPPLSLLGQLAWHGAVGAAIGGGGGWLLTMMLNRLHLPAGLRPILAAIAAIAIYGATAALDASGFLAVYVAGLVIGNRPLRDYAAIADFHDAASWFAQLAMFTVLGLLATPSRVLEYALPASALAVFLIVIGRPVASILCLAPFRISLREISFISWVGLRGAVSIFLAIIPILAGLPHGTLYFDMAFFVVFSSILIQGGTAGWLARILDLTLQRRGGHQHRMEITLPDAPGFEMIGYRLANEEALLLVKHIPEEARLSFIRRDRQIFLPEEWRDPQLGDIIYLLVKPQDRDLLDQAFALQADLANVAHEQPLFPINGEQTLAHLAAFYDVTLPPADASLTIADLFNEEFDQQPRLGDRIPFGNGWLIALLLQDRLVAKAGFLVPDKSIK